MKKQEAGWDWCPMHACMLDGGWCKHCQEYFYSPDDVDEEEELFSDEESIAAKQLELWRKQGLFVKGEEE